MTEKWVDLPLNQSLYANIDEDAIISDLTACENAFINDKGQLSRFPGFELFARLEDNGRTFLHDLDGDLIAATDKGRVYRIDKQANVEAISGTAVSGGRRVVFQKTDKDLLMAAGGPIVRLRNRKTEELSKNAPRSTHVGWIDGYTIGVEINSGRFYHDGANNTWDALDTFSADGNPDNINSLIITPFRELLLGGPKSIEQFERLPTGSVPFFRRWAIGDGVKHPYAILFADNAAWTINGLNEFVRFSQQQSVAASDNVGRLLEEIDDWREAWIGGYPDNPLHVLGHKFMVLQAPYATNAYGTRGVTLAFDYKNKRWFSLYGWDGTSGLPTRWPGWSHWTLWNRRFIGGEGAIYELKTDVSRHHDAQQRFLIRTGHVAEKSDLQIKSFRLRVSRGVGSSSQAPDIRVRCSRDGRAFGPWITRSLGAAGDRIQFVTFGGFGNGSVFQFEIACGADCKVELIGAQVLVEQLGH